tara:strand:+ start:1248 stop:1496 length:249 start_codon:yes stop_codon:yes gene_type:complete
MDITKTQKAVDHWLAGNQKKAFGIFKTFRLGFTKEDKRMFEMAHEILSGKDSFYKQLGHNTANIVVVANMLVRDYIDSYAND